MRMRKRLLQAGAMGKLALGAVLLAVGLFIASGLDNALEAFALTHRPAWLIDVTTRF